MRFSGRRLGSLPRAEGGRHLQRRLKQGRPPRGAEERRQRPVSEKLSVAWREARELLLERRGRLAIGLGLMLVNRLAGLVLPASSKYLIDEVVTSRRADLLVPIAVATLAATLVQSATTFALSQILGVAAQR